MNRTLGIASAAFLLSVGLSAIAHADPFAEPTAIAQVPTLANAAPAITTATSWVGSGIPPADMPSNEAVTADLSNVPGFVREVKTNSGEAFRASSAAILDSRPGDLRNPATDPAAFPLNLDTSNCPAWELGTVDGVPAAIAPVGSLTVVVKGFVSRDGYTDVPRVAYVGPDGKFVPPSADLTIRNNYFGCWQQAAAEVAAQ